MGDFGFDVGNMWEKGRRGHKVRRMHTAKGRRLRALRYSRTQAVAAGSGGRNRSSQVARVSPGPCEMSSNVVTDLDSEKIEEKKGKPEKAIDSSR